MLLRILLRPVGSLPRSSLFLLLFYLVFFTASPVLGSVAASSSARRLSSYEQSPLMLLRGESLHGESRLRTSRIVHSSAASLVLGNVASSSSSSSSSSASSRRVHF